MPSSLRFALRLLVVLIVIPTIVLCQVAAPSPPVDRHAKKIQEALVSCPAGSTVLIVMRDRTTHLGAVGAVSDTSFDLIRRNGEALNLPYAEVQRVQCADRDTGTSVAFHRHHSAWVVAIVAGTLVVLLIAAAEATR
jgi:hypothetical protein